MNVGRNFKHYCMIKVTWQTEIHSSIAKFSEFLTESLIIFIIIDSTLVQLIVSNLNSSPTSSFEKVKNLIIRDIPYKD